MPSILSIAVLLSCTQACYTMSGMVTVYNNTCTGSVRSYAFWGGTYNGKSCYTNTYNQQPNPTFPNFVPGSTPIAGSATDGPYWALEPEGGIREGDCYIEIDGIGLGAKLFDEIGPPCDVDDPDYGYQQLDAADMNWFLIDANENMAGVPCWAVNYWSFHTGNVWCCTTGVPPI